MRRRNIWSLLVVAVVVLWAAVVLADLGRELD
jgi:hypothetical protein